MVSSIGLPLESWYVLARMRRLWSLDSSTALVDVDPPSSPTKPSTTSPGLKVTGVNFLSRNKNSFCLSKFKKKRSSPRASRVKEKHEKSSARLAESRVEARCAAGCVDQAALGFREKHAHRNVRGLGPRW